MAESISVMCVQIPGSVPRAKNTSVQEREFRVGVQLVQFPLRGTVLQLDWDGGSKRSRQDSQLSIQSVANKCYFMYTLPRS